MAQQHAPGKMMLLHVKDRQTLYNSYMPFLEYGGLFIPTEEEFHMGDEVLLALQMGENPEKRFLRGNVAWINRAASTAQRPRGIGVAFSSDEVCITTKNQLENQIGTALKSDRPTFTL